MASSPSHGSPRRGGGSPSKQNPSAAAATLTPRRPGAQRTTGGETQPSPSAGSRLATSLALAAQDTLLTASATNSASPPSTAHDGKQGRTGTAGGGSESGNPHVRAIQSRVAELVRRYDESMESRRNDEEDDDEDRLDIPTRWRVGDLLLATHSSLAKTSTRTERSMMAEFAEDVEVSQAIGEGEQSFSRVLEQAAQKAEQMKAVLAKTLHVVKQLQMSDESDDTDKDTASSQQRLRELKITVEALHKEKSMVLVQLHEHVKSHKEMVAMMEEQTQELRKAQIAIACKQDELKSVREDFSFRLNDLQKMNETSQQTVGMWRDKYQTTLKSLGETEQRVTELEHRVQAQSEEVTKHDFILRAKNSELEKYKERLKDSEAGRLRAETAQREAATAAAESAAEAAAAYKKAEAAATKAKTSTGDAQVKMSSKEKQELEVKIRQQEATIRDLQRRLSELTDSRSKFEDDNNELARIVRELQAKAQELMSARPAPVQVAAPSPPPRIASVRRTSFTLSLRSMSKQTKRRSSSSNGERRRSTTVPNDDLSTDSEDEGDGDSDTERDERELNDTVMQVVTSVFPQYVSPMEGQSDENISDSIAQYENDPTSSSICPVIEDDVTTTRRLTATMTLEERPPTRGSSASATTIISVEGGGNASLSELAQLQLAHTEQIARLKKQYVAGLLEYKKLIIEQYERRQNEIQQHHRMEIENLILAVQEKFKRELERRGERVLQAKESLKLLYRAMQGNGISGYNDDGSPKRSGLGSFAEEGDTDLQSDDEDRVDEPVPLKSILRAAVFAMSSSKSRNNQASNDIKHLYDDMRNRTATPREPVVKIMRKNDAERAPEVTAPATPDTKNDTDWAAFLKSMRANRDASTRSDAANKGGASSMVHVASQVDDRDFVIFDLKGLRGSHVQPESLDGYVLPALPLSTRSGRMEDNHDVRTSSPRGRAIANARGHSSGGSPDGVLYLNVGALLSDDVVAELRAVLPFLPPGSYFLSSALRHLLLLEMLRFYSELGKRSSGKPHARPLPPAQPAARQQREESVEVVLGSPRDTPFLRRKAVESVERRQRLSNGGLALVQPAAIVPGFVSAVMATSSLSNVRHGVRPS